VFAQHTILLLVLQAVSIGPHTCCIVLPSAASWAAGLLVRSFQECRHPADGSTLERSDLWTSDFG